MKKIPDPIVDKEARARALDPSRSFIVQAPAGSGKTELLMQRFLALLATVDYPEQVLAMTFTRKAAGEMHTRINDALRAASVGREATDEVEVRRFKLAAAALKRDTERGWRLLENPARLKVRTIDSFCSTLSARMPLLSRLGGGATIVDNATELYDQAACRIVALVEVKGGDGDSVRSALRHLDNSVTALEGRLVLMLAKRDQWLRHVSGGASDKELKASLEGSLKKIVREGLSRVVRSVPRELAGDLVATAAYAGEALSGLQSESVLTRLAHLKELPAADVQDLPLWRALASFVLTDKDEARKPKGVSIKLGFAPVKKGAAKEMKERFKGLLERLAENAQYADFIKELTAVRALPDARYSEEEWDTLKALLHLLPVADAALMRLFEQRGEVDFQAVSMAALASLGTEDDPTDLMLSLDLRLRHILVDEYQDTSRTQLALIKALTRGWEDGDGRTLFIVGDPMQSIYLFREAEVGLFIEARNSGVGNVRPEPLTLKSNFRSQANIVDWVNETLARTFASVEDTFTGKVRYERFDATRPAIEGLVPELCVYPGRDDKREAEDVAGVISTLRGTVPGQSVAVLVRSRAHLGEIVRVLKDADIDFTAEEIDPLAQSPVVSDLTALVRALCHPMDRTAWLALLRAPWCGLGLADIHALCLGAIATPMWSLMTDDARVAPLSDGAAARLKGLTSVMDRAMTQRGRVPTRVLIEGLWTELGGAAAYLDDNAGVDADAFFCLLGAMGEGPVSVDLLEERVAKLFRSHVASPPASPEPQDKAVASELLLMTIHKAKGLEFDHVIVPGLGRGVRSDEKRLLFWMEREADLLLAPIDASGSDGTGSIYGYLDGVQKAKEASELARLFYVAVTRAKKQVYLFGHLKEAGAPAPAGTFLSTISDAFDLDKVCAEGGDKVDGAPEAPGWCAPDSMRFKSGWLLAEAAPPIEAVRPPETETAETGKPVFHWAGEHARHLGTVTHRYLCRIAKEGPGKWSGQRIDGELGRIISMLVELGLGASEAKVFAKRSASALKGALSDERGRWILGAHEEASVEVALSAVVEGRVKRVVIDRTFVDTDDVRWVIDYKTSVHEGGSIDDFLESEKQRYHGQLEGYAAMLGAGGEPRVIKRGLYFPALGRWVEWE